MKQLSFRSIPEFPIAEGATEPNLGVDSKGAWAWSTVLLRPVYWNGALWTAGSSSPDPLDLSTSNPIPPAAGNVRIFGRDVGGRMMPAFKGPSGLDSTLQPSFARNKMSFVIPQGNSISTANIGLTLTANGTATLINVATTNLHTAMRRVNYLTTTASTTATCGFRHAATMWFRGVSGSAFGGFHFTCRFGPATGFAANATRRAFCGFSSSTILPTDNEPTAVSNAIGVGAGTADVNYHILHRTGTGTAVKVDTGIPKSAADATEVYELSMFCAPGADSISFEFINLTTNQTFRHTATTSLPAPTTLLAPSCYYSVGGTSSVIGVALMGLYIETDY